MIIADCILGQKENLQTEKAVVSIMYEWFECEKGRILKTAEDGTEIGIAVAGGVKNGDILWETEESVYIVDVKPARLIEVKTQTCIEAARAGFELGNRHLSLKIEEERILVPFDEPTYEYLQKFGFEVREIIDIFDQYTVCKAHGHSHHG